MGGPVLADGPFYGACRYMGWLSPVPLLLLKSLLVMKLLADKLNIKGFKRGLCATLILVSGHVGESGITGGLTPRRRVGFSPWSTSCTCLGWRLTFRLGAIRTWDLPLYQTLRVQAF